MHLQPGGDSPIWLIEIDASPFCTISLEYRDSADETISDICGRADDKLFDNIISCGDRHIICCILSVHGSEVNIIQ